VNENEGKGSIFTDHCWTLGNGEHRPFVDPHLPWHSGYVKIPDMPYISTNLGNSEINTLYN
jgi:hypothetical protein